MILVVGGTGMVGKSLVRRFTAEGAQVRVLSRNVPSEFGVPFEHVAGDVRDLDAVRAACRGMEAVVHLAAIIREKGPQTFQAVNVKGTQNIVRAAQEAGVRRFVAMSVLGAQETPRFPYLRSRWLGEQAIVSSGLDFTVIRSSLLFGGPEGIVMRLVQSIKLTPPPFVVLPNGGRTRFQPLWVEDLAACLADAVWDKRHVGQVYEVGGPQYLTFRQMMDAVLRARGQKRIHLSVPVPLMVPSVLGMGLIFRDPPVTMGELRQLGLDNVADLDAVPRIFRFTPEPMGKHLEAVRDL